MYYKSRCLIDLQTFPLVSSGFVFNWRRVDYSKIFAHQIVIITNLPQSLCYYLYTSEIYRNSPPAPKLKLIGERVKIHISVKFVLHPFILLNNYLVSISNILFPKLLPMAIE